LVVELPVIAFSAPDIATLLIVIGVVLVLLRDFCLLIPVVVLGSTRLCLNGLCLSGRISISVDYLISALTFSFFIVVLILSLILVVFLIVIAFLTFVTPLFLQGLFLELCLGG